MRVAIVGTGISGLVCAHLLQHQHDITVFEADDRLGGHTNTVRIDLPDESHQVDTGFIVHNDRNYPNLVRLFDELGVRTQPSEMSFSVADESTGIEYRGTNLNTVFAQRRNLVRPSFLRMLGGIVAFNKAARALVADGSADVEESLDSFLDRHGFGDELIDRFIVPLGSSIWSADPRSFLDFPAVSYARFMENHGLLDVRYGVRWRTVSGGSKTYVDAIAAPLADRIRLDTPVEKIARHDRGADGSVEVVTGTRGPEAFDAVVLACHSDQALRMLADPTTQESEILGAIRYQPNIATLHTDRRMLPRTRRAWASWNYHLGGGPGDTAALTYWMNNLQDLESRHEILVTLNRHDEIDPDQVLGRYDYAHPMFDAAAMAAQRRHAEIQGTRGTYFAGAYWGYGFHEDGVRSALDVCQRLGVEW